MKPSTSRAVPFLLLLLLVFPASLSAISVFDVIRLTQEKYSDREIIRIIQLTDSRFALKADDTARLKQEGVTESVIREMLSRPASDKGNVPPPQSAARPSRSSASSKDSANSVPRDSSRNVAPAEPPAPSRDPAAILDEIVRLTKAGLSDETVLAYAKAHRGDLPAVLPAERLNWLRDSGVSRNVILYLTAIDVRASADGSPEGAYYESDEAQNVPQTAPAEPPPSSVYPPRDYAYDEGQTDQYGESYAVDPGYGGFGGYGPPSDYVSYYGDPGYWGGYGGWYYPWPSYFFVDVSGCFGRFHHHHHGHGHGHGDGHHGDGHHGWGGDHGGGGGGGGGRGGDAIAGQTWRDRPALARDNFTQGSRQPRTDFAPRGALGGSSSPSRGLDRASRGTFGGPRVVGRPGFSGGPGTGTAMTRGQVSRGGGRSPGVVGRPGFSGGMGGGGRAPIARSGSSFGGGRSGGFSGGARSGGFSGGGGRSGGFSGGGMRGGGGGGGGARGR